jgi:DNA mismatch endonuclease Vsr
MRLIKAKRTKPELKLFAMLDQAGIRYKPHAIVAGITVDALVGDGVVLFVDSPFWHLRAKSELRRLSPYWQNRLVVNTQRDKRQTRLLRGESYVVLRFWADELVANRVLRRLRMAVIRSATK